MIEIIYDPYQLQQPAPDDFVLKSENDYESCLTQIKDSVNHGKSLIVWVINPGLRGWLDHIGPKFGGVVRYIDPVQSLSSALKHGYLPEYFKTPEFIVQFDLIEKAKVQPLKLGESPESWGHRVLIGNIWSQSEISTDEEIESLLSWFMLHENNLPNIINELLNRRFRMWMSKADSVLPLLTWLQPDPFMRARYLVWENLLSTYPENHIPEWLQFNGIWGVLSQFTHRKKFTDCITNSSDIQLPPEIANFVRSFLFETWEKQSPMACLSYISGKLDVETMFLIHQLQLQLQQGQPISQNVHEKILEVSHGNQKVVELSEMLLLKQPPNTLSKTANFDDLRLWLKDDYLPFYRYCSNLNRLDTTIDLVKSFEKWLVQEYTSHLVSGEGMAYRQMHSLKKRMTDAPILIVMMDALDYLSFQDYLLPKLVRLGLYPEGESLPYLSFLPTETHISKPAVLRGKMPSHIPDEKPTADYYQGLIEELFKLKPDSVRSATDRDMTIEELLSVNAQIYLYLDNQLDREYIHSAYLPYVRRKKIADHCEKIAEAIAQSIQSANDYQGTYPLICICSDHGYTELPENPPVMCINTKSKNRSTTDLNPEWNSESVWSLSPELFGLNSPMTIPLHYGCFGSKPRGASHGGCTPQEMAVPWMVFSKTKPVPMLPITISIEGIVFRKRRKNPITVCISNPNPYSVRLMKLAIDKVDIPDFLPINIDAQSVVKKPAQVNGSEISTGFISLIVQTSFSCTTGKLENKSTITLETSGSMSTEFDDEFDA